MTAASTRARGQARTNPPLAVGGIEPERWRTITRRVRRAIRDLALGTCAVLCQAPGAEVIPWLYEAEVPIASQSEADRQHAASVALAQVLTRVTGMANVPLTNHIAAALAAPEHYALSYRFSILEPLPVPIPSDLGDLPEAAGPERDADRLRLAVRFDAEAVRGLVRDAQLPIWAADRPVILVWLAVRERGPGLIVAADAAGDWRRALLAGARRRGLNILLPLMDMTDAGLPAAAVWGRFWAAMEAASGRYRPDLLLAGRAAPSRDGWTADWALRSLRRFEPGGVEVDGRGPLPGASAHGGDEAVVVDVAAGADVAGDADVVDRAVGTDVAERGLELAGESRQTVLRVSEGRLGGRFQHQATSPEEIAHLTVDALADALAARFAVRGGADRAFRATVRGAQTLRGYAALLEHLGTREYIDGVDVIAATPKTLEIRLRTRSSFTQLHELLKQDDKLACERNSEGMDITWLGSK